MANRIGPQMAYAVRIVSANPGIIPYRVARQLHVACLNGRNNALGYNPINRAIDSGLLVCHPCPENASRSRLLTADDNLALTMISRLCRLVGRLK